MVTSFYAPRTWHVTSTSAGRATASPVLVSAAAAEPLFRAGTDPKLADRTPGRDMGTVSPIPRTASLAPLSSGSRALREDSIFAVYSLREK